MTDLDEYFVGWPQPWTEQALCTQTDPDAFYPEKGESTTDAKKVCLACEVRTECLEEAIATKERYGVWGGMSERERRTLIKEMEADEAGEVAA